MTDNTIDKLNIGGFEFVNVPASMDALLGLGMPETEAVTMLSQIELTNKKQLIRDTINKERDRRIYNGLLFKDTLIQTDEKSQKNINGAVTAITLLTDTQKAAYKQQWIAADNNTVEFTAIEFLQLAQLVAKHVSDHTLQAGTLKQRVTDAATVLELDGILDEYLKI